MHARPLVVDDGPHVRADGAAHPISVGRRERAAVAHDRRQSIRFVAHVALGVAVVLVGDHDDEREQQAEQRRDDAEHLRGDLRVEPLADGGYEPPDQPDEQERETHDRRDDQNQEQPGIGMWVDQSAQHGAKPYARHARG